MLSSRSIVLEGRGWKQLRKQRNHHGNISFGKESKGQRLQVSQREVQGSFFDATSTHEMLSARSIVVENRGWKHFGNVDTTMEIFLANTCHKCNSCKFHNSTCKGPSSMVQAPMSCSRRDLSFQKVANKQAHAVPNYDQCTGELRGGFESAVIQKHSLSEHYSKRRVVDLSFEYWSKVKEIQVSKLLKYFDSIGNRGGPSGSLA
jgi:hypothetical protein